MNGTLINMKNHRSFDIKWNKRSFQCPKIIAIFILNEPTRPEINFSVIFDCFDDEIMVVMVKSIVNL